jgi:hypothetical protein
MIDYTLLVEQRGVPFIDWSKCIVRKELSCNPNSSKHAEEYRFLRFCRTQNPKPIRVLTVFFKATGAGHLYSDFKLKLHGCHSYEFPMYVNHSFNH